MARHALGILLFTLAVVPLAAATCAQGACITTEESRTGGSCHATDARSAELAKYYNASVAVAPVRVEGAVEVLCVNRQPSPSTNANYNFVAADVVVDSPGRQDAIAAGASYGGIILRCHWFVRGDLGPAGPEDPSFSAGDQVACGETNSLPPLAELLP